MSEPAAPPPARSVEAQRAHECQVVAEHYDHPPEVFGLVLDRRLGYATGIFTHPDESLEAAQTRKYARLASLLALEPGDRVLDVGCGWGSNLLYLAETTDAVLQGITLSHVQCDFTRRRAAELGVAGRVQVDCCHVEDLALGPESLDAVLFVGSIVHMHHRDEIHRRIGRALRPGGRLVISDCFFPSQLRGDRDSAARHYIFEEALGHCRLLSLPEELALIEHAGLDVSHVEDLTASYVLTLARWIDNVRRRRAAIEKRAPGFSRVLQCYMTIAKLSFQRRHALEYLILARRPRLADHGRP
jgi:cyclopropane-fatty-acyl-phospholipid synthase